MVEEIRRGLMRAADPKYREQIERLVPGVRARGARVPEIRAQARSFAASRKQLSFAQACGLLDELAAGGWRDDMLFGVFLVAKFTREIAGLSWDRLEKWIEAIDNWETCDQLAMNIAAPLVAADPSRVSALMAMTKSKRLFERRFAVATAAALNQKGRSMPAETLRVCARLIDDDQPLVRKAVAWAIREASEQDEAAAFELLRVHRERAHPTLLREASEKLTPVHRKLVLG